VGEYGGVKEGQREQREQRGVEGSIESRELRRVALKRLAHSTDAGAGGAGTNTNTGTGTALLTLALGTNTDLTETLTYTIPLHCYRLHTLCSAQPTIPIRWHIELVQNKCQVK
jgi:hypothetical protein